jgi:acetate kinase
LDLVVNLLVLNAGSSSIKWSLLEAASEARVASGSERWRPDEADARVEAILERAPEFSAVGHRIVHGGEAFRSAVVIDAAILRSLSVLEEMDPLHAGPALAGVRAVLRLRPGVANIAAFDTAFHATIPEIAAVYPIPHGWTSRFRVRRFGFHGLSVAYAIDRAQSLLGLPASGILVLHLGSGASITAVRDGRSIDTTMGMTPLEGLMMSTRSGSIDPGIPLHLERSCGLSADEIARALQRESGLLGVSGISGDLRAVLEAADRGDPRADLAYRMYVLSIVRASGAMLASLGGADALVFTGGAGENSPRLRRDVIARLTFMGAEIDRDANERGSGDRDLSAPPARVRTLVVEAREDLAILREARPLLD